jgi:hypothetical protein
MERKEAISKFNVDLAITLMEKADKMQADIWALIANIPDAPKHYPDATPPEVFATDVVRFLLDKLKAAEQRSPWISVEDELPDDEQWVRVSDGDIVCPAYYFPDTCGDGCGYFFETSDSRGCVVIENENITHWRLPLDPPVSDE